MIVEDELFLRLDLVNQLHSAGFEVSEAQCADEALKILATNIDVDLILTDIRMPGQIDGPGLVLSMQRQDRDIKLILLSAYIIIVMITAMIITKAGGHKRTAARSFARSRQSTISAAGNDLGSGLFPWLVITTQQSPN